METEIYKWIPGYEGLYKVSNFGNVLSFHKNENGEFLKATKGATDYVLIGLSKNKKQKIFRLNRIVCEVFNGKSPSKKHQANHLDGNKKNNRADNLEWTTAKQNSQHAVANKLRRINNGAQKQIVIQKTLNGEIIKIHEGTVIAAKEVEGTYQGISMACNKNLKTYKGFIWEYAEVAQ
ncbi:NUMOD4 motif-containing HNH endonuclease [Neobacillus niacini]|uniref:NUMOD4 motif-containing HNH endonuclease n=1 Tax=Neobacillus niacini TaxID=86668 RepID=UPI000694CFB0|nr:NUMOD4 motif-containing HNH endonuclease [Neobacillus niacini]